jgi:hypothetical protein
MTERTDTHLHIQPEVQVLDEDDQCIVLGLKLSKRWLARNWPVINQLSLARVSPP